MHKKMNAWKQAVALVTRTYRATEAFPRREMFGLTSQMRRAAVSIPSNIAEGAAHGSPREYIRFLRIATGSVSELETQYVVAEQLGYINCNLLADILREVESVKKLLFGVIRSQKAKLNPAKSEVGVEIESPVEVE